METVTLAILDEPPFCWLADDGTPAGCDVDVATIVLRLAGVGSIDVRQMDFAELIPGVLEGRWQVNTGMFVTEERRRRVRFTRPIWSVPDGLIVRRERGFASYQEIGLDPEARLAVVVGQVQADAACAAGVPAERLVHFDTQDESVRAVQRNEVDAAASTAIGNRALVARIGDPALVAVDLPGAGALGAFSLSHSEAGLADRIDAQLATFIGSPEHRALMARYGFGEAAIPST